MVRCNFGLKTCPQNSKINWRTQAVPSEFRFDAQFMRKLLVKIKSQTVVISNLWDFIFDIKRPVDCPWTLGGCHLRSARHFIILSPIMLCIHHGNVYETIFFKVPTMWLLRNQKKGMQSPRVQLVNAKWGCIVNACHCTVLITCTYTTIEILRKVWE